MLHDYPVPAKVRETTTEVKKSRFIAHAAHVIDRAEAMRLLQRLRDDYPEARHHCWAYLIGDPRASCEAAMNDDGEPGGTAGKPILNVIRHKGIGDVMVVVVRYFGGVKLGAGGLTRAYAAATESVLSGLKLVQHEPMLQVQLAFDFSHEQPVRRWAEENRVLVGEPVYSHQVELMLQIPARLEKDLVDFCQSRGVVCHKLEQENQ